MISPELREKFWSKVNKRDKSSCWIWKTSTSRGYGVFWAGDKCKTGSPKNVRAHRFSYELHNGPISEGAYILHSCHNKLCVNPNHLREGNQKDNMRDMWEAGRAKDTSGEGNGRSKLNSDLVKELRTRYKNEGFLLKDLAKEYGICIATVHRAVNHVSWKEV